MKPERPAETADRPAATLKIPLATMAGTGERQRLLRRALREAAMSSLGLRRQGGVGGDSAAGGPGSGGDASASSSATSRGPGKASSSANATSGTGGYDPIVGGGYIGNATAVANSSAAGGGMATANAAATSGISVSFQGGGVANATSYAETTKGALAQAQSSAGGVGGEYAQSTAKTSFAGVSVESTAQSAAPFFFSVTTSMASTAGGGADQALAFADSSDAYGISTALPDQAYVTTLIDGATTVADALLGPHDIVFGTAILGGDASATFDFTYRGDLLVGLVDDDAILDLGSNLGPNINLTFSEPGIFVIGGVVPEPPDLGDDAYGIRRPWLCRLSGFAQNRHSGIMWAKERLRQRPAMCWRLAPVQISAGRKRRALPCQKRNDMLHVFLFAESISVPASRQSAGLFEPFDHNPARESERGEKFFTFFGRNPLKSPDSEK
jgi:hypothetical protein